MADYINRTELIRQIDLVNDSKLDIYKTIMHIQREHAKEIIHAEWWDYGTYLECSECGATYDVKAENKPDYRYCPFCGAKMDGGLKDENNTTNYK